MALVGRVDQVILCRTGPVSTEMRNRSRVGQIQPSTLFPVEMSTGQGVSVKCSLAEKVNVGLVCIPLARVKPIVLYANCGRQWEIIPSPQFGKSSKEGKCRYFECTQIPF